MSAPWEKKKAEHILRRYISRDEDSATKLLALDAKVKRPGRLAASLVGYTATLVFGAGMSLVLVWESYAAGIALGILGMTGAAAAYPTYRVITNSRRRRYRDDIMRLTDEILDGRVATASEKGERR